MGLLSVAAAFLVPTAPPANIAAGRMEERRADAGLRAAIEQVVREGSGPTWIGYTVESDQDGSVCCWNSVRKAGGCCGGCRLEAGRGDVGFHTDAPRAVALEGPRRARILLRAAAGRIQQVRAFSEGCALDVGGLPLVWLQDVKGSDSADFLGSLVADDGGRGDEHSLTDGPLLALSLHADPRAVDVMVKAAREHRSSHVRKQALFWLSQTASRRVAPALQAAVDDDPDLEVKKSAVFALSQMEPSEGVPHLIRVARTNAQREVRKQAIFWLGQSEDPRALAFFEEVLGH